MSKEEREAKRLIKKYGQYTDGYVGSSQMTFTEYPDVKLKRTKELVHDVVKDILDIDCRDMGSVEFNRHGDFYTKVLKHVDNYNEEVCELCRKVTDINEMKLESEEGNWICNSCIDNIKK